MAYVDRIAIHEGATADDAGDAAGVALVHGILRNASLPERAMEPDVRDVQGLAFPYDFDGYVRVGRDDNALNGFGKRAEIGVTAHALDLGGVGIDGEDLESRVAQPSVDGVGWLSWVARHSSNSESPVAEKLRYSLRLIGHRVLVSSECREGKSPGRATLNLDKPP